MPPFTKALFAAAGLNNAKVTSVFDQQLREIVERTGLYPGALMDEICVLEGKLDESGNRMLSRTKAPNVFNRRPLTGLSHKHYFTGRHVAQNAWNALPPGSDSAARAMLGVLKPLDGTTVDGWDLAGKIADRFVHDAIAHRQQGRQLTGDWIVYKRHNKQNYYLCLATHDESDDTIFSRLAPAAEAEFSELRIRAGGK